MSTTAKLRPKRGYILLQSFLICGIVPGTYYETFHSIFFFSQTRVLGMTDNIPYKACRKSVSKRAIYRQKSILLTFPG